MTCIDSVRQGIISPGVENQIQQFPVDFLPSIDSANTLMQNGAVTVFDSASNTEPGLEFSSFKSGPSAQPAQRLACNPCQQSLLYSDYATNVDRLWFDLEQQQVLAQIRQRQQRMLKQQKKDTAFAQTTKRSTTLETENHYSPTDPIIEKKISQLFKSMKRGVGINEDEESKNMTSRDSPAQVLRKNEKEMDDDEKILASEEGKMLSSKERRQLRNKVSARAFRSRRKEYIHQLEDQIASSINEIRDLRAQNQALTQENIRLSDLTRMLLSLPSIPGLLEPFVTNPLVAQATQANQCQMDVVI